MRLSLGISCVAMVVLLSACGRQNVPNGDTSGWSTALQNIEETTGVKLVPDVEFQELLDSEGYAAFSEVRAYKQEGELGETTAQLFTWKQAPDVVDWYVRVPNLDKDVYETYHADGTVEREAFSSVTKKAFEKFETLTAPVRDENVIAPLSNEDGGGGSAGHCTDYCVTILKT